MIYYNIEYVIIILVNMKIQKNIIQLYNIQNIHIYIYVPQNPKEIRNPHEISEITVNSLVKLRARPGACTGHLWLGHPAASSPVLDLTVLGVGVFS
jgi:hypothetical protein